MPNSAVALAAQKLAASRDKVAITVTAGSTDLTGKECASTGFHWAYDTYSNTAGVAQAMVGFGLDTWYFITVDYAFGWTLEQTRARQCEKAGGRVVGRSHHPLGAADFSEVLTAAQDSGAKVIALANAGGDTINAVRQAAEIGISPRSQTLVPLLVFISDVNSLGLDIAKGMTFIDGFYWDADNRTREWSKRFYARRGVMPTMAHAGVYSAVLHYLRSVQGIRDRQRKESSRPRCGSYRSTIFSPRAASCGPTAAWFMTCTSSRSSRPKNPATRGTITKSCRPYRERKPFDL